MSNFFMCILMALIIIFGTIAILITIEYMKDLGVVDLTTALTFLLIIIAEILTTCLGCGLIYHYKEFIFII